MKRITTFFALVLALTIFNATAHAQSRMTDAQKEEMKKKYAAYREKLNLSPEQSTKVEKINTAFFEGLSEIKNSNERKLSKYKKFKSLQSTRDAQMKDVLTPDQYKLFKEFQEEMQEEFKENRRANK